MQWVEKEAVGKTHWQVFWVLEVHYQIRIHSEAGGPGRLGGGGWGNA